MVLDPLRQFIADRLLGTQHHGALHQVLEFADVSGPRVVLEKRHHRGRYLRESAVVFAVVTRPEVLDEERNGTHPFAQGRDLQRDHVEPIEEVLPKAPFLDRDFEVPIGRGHHSRVHPHVAAPAERRKLPVLEHLQQLRLERWGHLADLVQEDRAVVRELELAELLALRAGERALLEAEELALEQLGGQRGAVDLDEGLAAPFGALVERLRHELFAGSAFAANQHRNIGPRDLLDRLPERPHLGVVSADHLEVALKLDPAAQIAHLALERARLQGPIDGELEFFRSEGFAQKIACPGLHGLDDGARLAMAGEHHHGKVGRLASNLVQRGNAVATRENEIESHEIGSDLGQALECRLGVAKAVDADAPRLAEGEEKIAKRGIVIDDEKVDRSGHSSLSANSGQSECSFPHPG